MTLTLQALRTAMQPWNKVLVAFSGGLDSTVLLHQLVMLRDDVRPALALRAVHVHHGISPLAESWAEHCRQLCAQWQVPFTVCQVKLTRQGQSIEAEARQLRYQALAAELTPDEALVTAQHLDDQCETLLLALKRGSGPAGLAAMPAALAFHHSQLLRPLLGLSRQQLECWAADHQLSWIEDDSNQDDGYDRNFLRLRVLPLLAQRWPQFAGMVARSAELCGEQERLLDELLAEELEALMNADGALSLAAMRSMSAVRRSALLRRWLAWHRAPMPSRAALQRIWDEVAQSREDANPRMVFGTFEVRRYQDALWWVAMRESLRERVISWPAQQTEIQLPAKLGRLCWADAGMAVRAPRSDEPVSIRFTAPGTLYIAGRERGRSLKKLWQELNVAPWLRETTPLLCYGETVIAALGVFITRDGQSDGKNCRHIAWY